MWAAQVSFAAKYASVKVNDVALTPAEDGRYIFDVDGNTMVKVSKEIGASVEEISIEDAVDAIYTIEGIKVSDASVLPSGIYIKNGRKIIISR